MNNLNLIIGDDKKQIDYNLFSILNKIEHDDNNKIIYDMNNNTISDILDEASTISMFSSVKVIIGESFEINKMTDNDIAYLTKYLKEPNIDSYIILITNKIDSRLKNYKIFKDSFNIIDSNKTDNKDNLHTYIKQTTKEKSYIISDMDIDYLLEKTGNDINNINSELNKLMAFKSEKKEILLSDIDQLVLPNIDNVIYEFTNAILENDLNKIVMMYQNFKTENVSFDYLIVSIANTLRTALTIKLFRNKGMSNSEISTNIGKKEFYVKKMLERIYQYSEKDLSNYINKLAKIDYNYKTGNSNIDELELFLINK